MEKEIWKNAIYDGVIYEGYQVSNLGRVKSLNYRNTGRAELMSLYKDGWGYLRVGLRKDGKRNSLSVHRLVATAFIPNPENKPEVNHKIEGDEGKTMNFVFFNEDGSIDDKRTTIEWCSSEYNKNYGTRNKRISEKMTNGKTSKIVLQYSLDGDLIREWESTMECERNGFSHVHVCDCCNGKRKTYKGFRWEYEKEVV